MATVSWRSRVRGLIGGPHCPRCPWPRTAGDPRPERPVTHEETTMHRSSLLAPSFLAPALLTAGLALIALGPGATVALGEATVAAHAQAPAAAAAAPAAGSLLPLPQFKPCATTSHPLLPAKWEAVALMQDFFLPSFLVGKFVFDESAQAFRFRS